MVFHHFGSKDGLRTACDEHVLNVLVERARAAGDVTKGQYDLLGVYLANPDEYVLYVQYVVRARSEDAWAAARPPQLKED